MKQKVSKPLAGKAHRGIEPAVTQTESKPLPKETSPAKDAAESLANLSQMAESQRVESQRVEAAKPARNAEIEQFISIAAHDMQEPARTVALYSRIVADRYRGQLDANFDLEMSFIQDASRQMIVLLKDLLAYSRAGVQKNLEDVNCQIVLESVLNDLSAELIESHGSVDCENLPTINANRSQISQLFTHLINNALKFRHNTPPRITIGAHKQGALWQFAVTDNGIGIKGEQQPLVFAVMQRFHDVRGQGNGIGLATCKKIVEGHGGNIWLTSEPGVGSTFFFTLEDRRQS